ncbi:MAG: hypothetical protein AVDCRST_MAG41-3066 [uncultured Corynebacteriales bacterium]|uniref:NIPSNAP domain-containing protein n=1 Tax=uncultured Mycobacteriales bacterium TaxID=581187 RepID=A0A6J4J8S7_9ACTN|nr:MAG: hypothetical protein AVDCRST_MAG41-3066 [uncultured Corynebacteriales bacterium]
MTNADVPLVELRRYALHPGTRDEMIRIFERELMEGQEAAGMRLLGQFRDLDDPDTFVWLRGFRDMASRYDALWEFYTGPVWKAHKDPVNATMISSDDVLLLRPYGADGHLPAMAATRPPREATTPPGGLVVATTYPVADPEAAAARFTAEVGAEAVEGRFVTDPTPNTYKWLPVRGDASVFVTFARFADAAAYGAGGVPAWEPPGLTGPVRVARLAPTARSPRPA